MYFRNQTTTGKKFCLARDCLTKYAQPQRDEPADSPREKLSGN